MSSVRGGEGACGITPGTAFDSDIISKKGNDYLKQYV